MKQVDYEFCGVPFEIETPLPLGEAAEPFLRGHAVPQVRIFLEPRESLDVPEGELLGSSRDKQVWMRGSTVIRQSKDLFRSAPHMTVSYDLGDWTRVRALVRREDWKWATGDRYLWTGVGLNQLLLHADTLFLHASYIDCCGAGILFTAPSQTGKSTQAELWHRYRGAQVVNGDKAAVRLQDIPMAHSIPFSGTSGICENRSVPLKAIVVLSQAPSNTVRRMGPTEAVAALFPNVFVDQVVGEEWSMALNLLLDLTAEVPVYALACTPDIRAVEALERVLF